MGPGDATREARTQLGAQIFDGEDGFGADLEGGCGGHGRAGQRGAADEVRQGRGQTEAGAAVRGKNETGVSLADLGVQGGDRDPTLFRDKPDINKR